MSNGVLTVSLAKKEAAKPKQVKVEIGATTAQPEAGGGQDGRISAVHLVFEI